jgi:hypothetical protein
MIVALTSGVSRTFLVVYAREAFLQEDGMILLFSVFGGLGNLLAGMLIKFFVDKIGAKPILIICTIISLATMIPIVFFSSSAAGYLTTGILFLSFLFFMLNFGFLGSEGIAQTYFMGLVPPEKTLDMGILYFFCFWYCRRGRLIPGRTFPGYIVILRLFTLCLIQDSLCHYHTVNRNGDLFAAKAHSPGGALPGRRGKDNVFLPRITGHITARPPEQNPGFPSGRTAAGGAA